jgi:glyoxylase-like metal-dependent hydrolase (beta-lactamase superfamily II)
MITEVNRALKLSTDKTIIVPGHGEVGNRADLTDFRDMLVAISDNVKQLKQAGKTLAQIVAAKPTAAYDKKYGGFVIQPDLFTRLVYDGLK